MAIETPTWIYKSEGDKQTASEMNQLAQSVIINATELSNIKTENATELSNIRTELSSTKDDVAELSNKTYNPETYSGMGRAILRKNMVNGVNVLTQEMINQANTIYEIRYDFDLNGAEITIPAGCTLDFQGGSFSNGTLILNDTILENLDAFDYSLAVQGRIANMTGFTYQFFSKRVNKQDIDTQIKVFNRYVAYVNDTNYTYYFKVSGETIIPKPLVTKKSVIGSHGRTYDSLILSDKATNRNAGEGTIVINGFECSLEVSCVIFSIADNNIDIKDVYLYGSDGTTNNFSTIGLYIPATWNMKITGVASHRFTTYGICLGSVFMSEISNCLVIPLHGNPVDTGIITGWMKGSDHNYVSFPCTSLHMSSNYVRNCTFVENGSAYKILKTEYSLFTNNAADSNNGGDDIYHFKECHGITITNNGCESNTGFNTAFYVNGSVGSICNNYIYQNNLKISIIFITFTIGHLNIEGNLTGGGNISVNGIYISTDPTIFSSITLIDNTLLDQEGNELFNPIAINDKTSLYVSDKTGKYYIYPDGTKYYLYMPSLEIISPIAGQFVYDQSLKKMKLWNGTAWVNLDGTALT